MAIKLKPEYLKRYKDLAGLFLKYGRSDLLATAGLEASSDRGRAKIGGGRRPENAGVGRRVGGRP